MDFATILGIFDSTIPIPSKLGSKFTENHQTGPQNGFDNHCHFTKKARGGGAKWISQPSTVFLTQPFQSPLN